MAESSPRLQQIWPRIGAAIGRVVAPAKNALESSLQLRVVTLTAVATILVVLLGGQVLLSRAGSGIVEAKKQSSIAEASIALQRMQSQLNDTDLRNESVLERLGQLADEVGSQGTQYALLIQAPTSYYITRGLEVSSVPVERFAEAGPSSELLVTTTAVRYADGQEVPGVVVAGHLTSPNGQSYPTYFIFPATNEVQTLGVLQQALWLAGAFLLIALGATTYWISRQVTVPLKQAANVSAAIASGNLDERMIVKRHDEVALLGSSLNDMAGELQRQIQALESLSDVQRRFVSDVSHELRTPMTTMRMATDVLFDAKDNFDPHLSRSIELLHDQEERFEVMLADLLEISRFDAGAAVLSVDEIDLVELVRSEIRGQHGVAEAVGSEVELAAAGPVVVEADGRRITRIVRNLLSNALTHGDGKDVVITIAADADVASLTVRDHGVGFDAAATDLVFERFWRADESRQRVVGGTGLGLAISLEDARLHNGWLEAWGSLGKGASFRLTLPKTRGSLVTHAVLPLAPEGL